ncbi:MAG: GNAT family N-acetyltransferase, partial [Actinomycetota bacterium]|nr:GNAT family N-acetyltransferase [Actinomycetota bacterium]
GVRYRLEPADARAIVSLLRSGKLRQGMRALAPRRRTAHAVFSVRDPGPMILPAHRLLAKLPGPRRRPTGGPQPPLPAPPAGGQDEHSSVQWLRGEAALESIVPAWRAISDDPFTSPEWLLSWWHAFGAGRALLAAALWRGEKLAALAVLTSDGDRLLTPTNEHTPHYDIAAIDEAARAQILRALLHSRYRAVVLDALPDTSRTTAWLRAHTAGRHLASRRRHVSPFVDTSVSKDAFRAVSQPRWKAPLDRYRRKMERENGASFHLLQAPENLDRLLDAGFAIEASGWKGEAGTAIISDPATNSFYRSLAHQYAATGELAVSWLSFGDEMVAFDLAFVVGGRVYGVKSGFDERHRRLAPGLVLRLAIIERGIELGLATHELLGDDADWKRKFASGDRAHTELRLYRRGPAGTASWVYWAATRPALQSAYLALRRRRPSDHV